MICGIPFFPPFRVRDYIFWGTITGLFLGFVLIVPMQCVGITCPYP